MTLDPHQQQVQAPLPTTCYEKRQRSKLCVRFKVGEFHDNKTFYEYVIMVEIY